MTTTINYIQILDEVFSVGASCVGDPSIYSNIYWNGVTPIDQTTLDAAFLDLVKKYKILDFSDLVSEDIRVGFSSSATGTPLWYDTLEIEDQVNIIGATLLALNSPDPVAFFCRNVASDVQKQHVDHTGAQLLQVLADGTAVKQSLLIYFNTQKDLINAATTTQDVDAIVYSSPRTGEQVPT